ncbi:MAG TPA: MerR family transcriptional regulator [Labilithrix sp.]
MQAEATLTIDDLASSSQVPSRTIRFYQSKGVLPKPEIRGRVAYYGEPHLDRLKLIAQLQDRGLQIDAIREVLTRVDRGEVDVTDWLGIDAQLREPWVDDKPTTVGEDQVYEIVGRRRVGLLADLLRSKLVERRGHVYLVPSPALLTIAGRLEAAGVDIVEAVKGGELLKKHLERAARDLIELFVKRGDMIVDPELVAAVRPAVLDAVHLVFAQAMEREIRGLVESGKTARVKKRRR